VIRPARLDDIPALIAIEVASGELFRAVGMTAVADDPPLSAEVFGHFVAAGRSFVHANVHNDPTAYILVEPLDGRLFVEQVTVSPASARGGLGAQLFDFAQDHASDFGMHGLSLTTFRDVRWNAPYYLRLGFEIVAASDLTLGLVSKLEDENSRGLAVWPRVAMRRG
jgi:GNAT superfamily N-acetyltransferase